MSGSLADLTASELLRAFAAGKATPTEAVAACMQRINETDAEIGAVLTVTAGLAQERAAESDERWVKGTARPLEGVPYGLKDVISTAGTRTTGGSALYRDHVPQSSALVEQRLAGAGGVLVAKLATFEFACGGAVNKTFGSTRNPCDPVRTSGGSSTGSGAAVALGQVPFALGTDTGGSVRIPSSFCGVTGIKATYGRVPRQGVMGLSWTMDHVGPMARSVEDVALVLDVISGPDPADPASLSHDGPFVKAIGRDAAGMRVARDRSFMEAELHPDVAAAYERGLGELAAMGVEIVDVSLSPAFDLLPVAAWWIIYAEMLSLHEPHLHDLEARDEQAASLLAAAPFVSAIDYLRALRLRPIFQRELEKAMAGCDALVTPGMTSLPPMIADTMMSDLGSRMAPWLEAACRTHVPFNLTGNPALVVPAGFVDGLPVSLQLVARPRDEGTALALGTAYQRATDHHLARPPALVARR